MPALAASKATLSNYFKWTEEEMNREFRWLEKRVRTLKDSIVLSHNDPHGGNQRVGNFYHPNILKKWFLKI